MPKKIEFVTTVLIDGEVTNEKRYELKAEKYAENKHRIDMQTHAILLNIYDKEFKKDAALSSIS